ncbi:MAG: hypothetical protein IPM17_09050 [Verrucomicrobia bacterium]|nr:hypothetical protein [Verrucomicrobiota bacterium]
MSTTTPAAKEAAFAIRQAIPAGGLFAGQDWRISPRPFELDPHLARELETLGRVLLQFYRAVNLLYRQSVEGRQPAWVTGLLDQGKPAELVALQRQPAFKNDVPRVIRPDILLTDDGFAITELDSVPGGIGLTAWLNAVYSRSAIRNPTTEIIGGARGMLDGFASICGDAPQVRIVVSEESATYRPEMEWIASQLGSRFSVHDAQFTDIRTGDAVYRFFELFDLANVPNAPRILDLAVARQIRLTPPPRAVFEEKLLFALLWNRNLREFWRQQLGEGFLRRLLQHVPYTWVVDPMPLPPHAAIPELNLTDWQQLKTLSQRERELILKVSGFHPTAWGARSVTLGSDVSQADWSAAVDEALRAFPTSPYVLQRYHKPRTVAAEYYDFDREALVPMPARARLCPYYFVNGEGDAARPHLGGVLVTLCPADKKIIHGMKDAILAPACVAGGGAAELAR